MNLKAPTSTVELFIEVFGDDANAMLQIAKCESGIQQFNKDGTPLWSRLNTPDVGILQINKIWHEKAEEMGLDIFHSEKDNLLMGKYILEKQGIKAWKASNNCHHLIDT